MKLLAYTIDGQKIGINIKSWTDVTLSGHTAFIAIADTGSTPSDYTNISSVDNWDSFGNPAGLTNSQVKNEIFKLIPNTPTQAQYNILGNYVDVGLNSMTKIGGTTILGSIPVNNTSLTGVTDTKYSITGGTVTGDIKSTGSICGVNGTLDIGGNLNVGGNQTMGGNLTMSGNLVIAGTGVVTSASNLGGGSGVYASLSAKNLQFKSLCAGSGIGLSSDANSILITGGGTGATITTLNTSATGNITTTSTTAVLMTGMQLTSVPAGKYLVGFGTSFSHSTTTGIITTSIYVNNVLVTNSEITTRTSSTTAVIPSGYSDFVITLPSAQTVEIRWRVSAGTGTANTNRYLTLTKVL